MPIRIKRDDHQSDDTPRRPGNNRRQTSSSGKGLLGILLPFLIKKPKLLILGLLLFGGYYLFQNGCNQSVVAPEETQSSLYKGCEMKPEEYDKAYVFAKLADKEKLPAAASLAKFCPPALNQGQQGSCVGWGSAYAARTIMEAIATGKNPQDVAFSPSYLYNQIKLPDCQGAYISKAMVAQQSRGALPFEYFRYNEQSCEEMPNRQMVDAAQQFAIHGYNRLTSSADPTGVDLEAVKQNIAKGGPVVVGMLVGGGFMQEMMGKDLWQPSQFDYSKRGFGGHCMCLVGYDDNKYGGAFQIFNSWGQEWGKNGFTWVRYDDFKHFTVEAYGIDPLPSKQSQAERNKMSAQVALIGIIDGKKGEARYGAELPLRSTRNDIFESNVLAKNQLFKVAIKNETPCYVYVLGYEVDGSCNVLFPYTEKHSAYCGITGLRVFPQDYNLFPDEVGAADYMSILVSKKPLDINAVKESFNQTGANPNDGLQRVLASRFIPAAKAFQNRVVFNYQASNADVSFVTLRINKK